MFGFLFGSKKNENNDTQTGFVKVNKQSGDCYVVLHNTTQEIIGVFDSLDKAKKQGQKATYHTCSIYSFKMNGACRYLNTAIYEDK